MCDDDNNEYQIGDGNGSDDDDDDDMMMMMIQSLQFKLFQFILLTPSQTNIIYTFM